mmetsp:Transcript_59503/g.87219  ORF Transcript_59503/g.87219 Transcript_59503/m.87219 type:complete len:261 (+) Transcript_59503:97-879(+)
MATENLNSMGEDKAAAWVPNEEGEDPKESLPFTNKNDLTTVKLYQMGGSPPCIMVQAMFSYADINYEKVDVSFPLKSEISWSTYKKIPIVTLNGLQVNDSYIIFKQLAPLIFGRTITESEAVQIKSVAYEAMIALEAETFENSDALSKFVDGYVAKDCCTANTMGHVIKLMLPQMASGIRSKNPDLKPFKTHCETFKAAITGKFVGGSEPGPYDIMMYALFAMHKHVKIDMYEEMWKELQLTEWYDSMTGVFAAKTPFLE